MRNHAVRARKRRRQTKRSGLTLIETLLAVAILGIALSVLVAAAGQALGVVRRARNYTTARHLFEIIELENPIIDLAEAAGLIESGGFDPPFAAYTWERIVEPMVDLRGEETEYYLIRTRVRWSDRGQPSYEEIVTGAYSPTETQGVAPSAEAIEAETEGGEGATAGGLRAPAPVVGGRGRRDERDVQDSFAGGVAGRGPDRGPRGMRGEGEARGVPEQALRRSIRDLMRPTRGREGERDAIPNVRPPLGSGRAGAGRAFTAGWEAAGNPRASLPVAPPVPPRSSGGFYGGPPPPPGF